MGSSDGSLEDKIQRRVDAGELPPEQPLQLWIYHGTDEPCSACDQTITPAQGMNEVDWNERTYHFHGDCYGLWVGALIRRGLSEPK